MEDNTVMCFKRLFLSFIAIMLVFLSCPLQVSATETGDIPILKEINLPEDISFSVNNTCSEHLYFMQATAREDGWFAVSSLHIDSNTPSKDNFHKVYIDIYDACGRFQQELEFNTPLSFTIEITEETLNIYFYTSMLVYDFETESLSNYSIPGGSVMDYGLYETLHKDEFTCGQWQYKCVKSFNGYEKLIRSNEDKEQVLVSMPGYTSTFLNTFIPGSFIAILFIALVIIVRKKVK